MGWRDGVERGWRSRGRGEGEGRGLGDNGRRTLCRRCGGRGGGLEEGAGEGIGRGSSLS